MDIDKEEQMDGRSQYLISSASCYTHGLCLPLVEDFSIGKNRLHKGLNWGCVQSEWGASKRELLS